MSRTLWRKAASRDRRRRIHKKTNRIKEKNIGKVINKKFLFPESLVKLIICNHLSDISFRFYAFSFTEIRLDIEAVGNEEKYES